MTQRPFTEFVQLVARSIEALRLAQTAASLASLSLLAFVPMLSIGFWVLALSPSFSRLRDVFLRLLEQIMLPTVSSTVVKYLNQFATRGADLPVLGVLGFLITALLALGTVEKTFHLIWQQPNRRSWWRRLSLSLAVLAIGPILVATGFALTVGIGTPLVDWLINFVTDTKRERRELSSFLTVLWPFFISWLALTLLYRMVPSVKVRWLAALLGGFIATVMLSLLKLVLTWYFIAFPVFKTVYGALATLPILLLWLNAVWLVVLIGAVIVANIERFEFERFERRWLPFEARTLGSGVSAKVMTGQEVYELTCALRTELQLQSPLVKEWKEVSALTCFKRTNRKTVDYLVTALARAGFVQIGMTPGTRYSSLLIATEARIRWCENVGKHTNRPNDSAESIQTAANDELLKQFIWTGSRPHSIAAND